MKIIEKYSDWFIEHDKNIMAAHLKKEQHTLKKELELMEEERDNIREYLRRLEALIEKQEELGFISLPTSTGST